MVPLARREQPLRILFVTSEMAPFSKTGGLGDVSGALPRQLLAAGEDVRVLVPWYGRPDSAQLRHRADLWLPFSGERVEILSPMDHPQWLFLRHPDYERPGSPYQNPAGEDWPDNAERFARLCRAAAEIAQGRVPELSWQAELVHANDWQTGLVPYLLELEARIGAARPRTLLTIHNLAYQGRFDPAVLERLHLPVADFHPQGTELYGSFSFLKAGLVYADHLSTVSPTYAREIQRPEFGMGLDGLLRARSGALSGILNGIDSEQWNPAADPYLPAHYSADDLQGKATCKARLQQELGLFPDPHVPLLGMISRLVEQKGSDLVLALAPELLKRGLQLVVLGSGERLLEQRLRELGATHRGQMAARIGFDEALSHRIEAGADMFLMPSRFEPCGLNQMYSLRYGTVPIVQETGGLADTVHDVDGPMAQLGNGFVFHPAQVDALRAAILRAERYFRRTALWHELQRRGMSEDHSWRSAALAYRDLYRSLL
ncbi:MAG: glycogen synthase GlgA [Acidithiobacillus sp.]|uniref:glycogen synthase GlgA n=1 Tax=Acidithiobacillus sp. TaxID=1872118 RepID=UPI003D06B800